MTNRGGTRTVPAETWMLAAGHVGGDFGQGAVPAIGAMLVAEHRLNVVDVGVLIVAVSVGSSFLQPLLGVVADRYRWRFGAAVGVAVAGIGLAGIGWSPTGGLMIASAALCGVGIALFHPAAGRLLPLTAPPELASRAMSVFALGGNIGFALGPIATATAAVLWGSAGIACLGLVPALATVPLVVVARRTVVPTPLGRSAGVPQRTGGDRWGAFGQLSAVITLRSTGFYALQALIPAHLINTAGASRTMSTAALTLLFAAGAAATVAGGWRAHVHPPMRLISWPLAAVAAGTALLAAAHSLPVAFIAIAVVGAATYAGFSPSINLGQQYLPSRPALAAGVAFGLAPGLGSTLALLVSQLAQSSGYLLAFVVLALAPIAALPAALALPRVAAPDASG